MVVEDCSQAFSVLPFWQATTSSWIIGMSYRHEKKGGDVVDARYYSLQDVYVPNGALFPNGVDQGN